MEPIAGVTALWHEAVGPCSGFLQVWWQGRAAPALLGLLCGDLRRGNLCLALAARRVMACLRAQPRAAAPGLFLVL